MAFTCGFYNSIDHDRTYNAVQMSQIFDGIINDGVYMGFMDRFMVTPSAGMTVQVGAGRAWFNHTWSYNDSPYMVRLSESSVGFNRIDAVCLVIDISDEVRANSIEVVEGDPATGTPVKPELVDTDTRYYHPLAYITVGSEVESITSADIENAVGTSATPFVTGIIETVEVDELVAQWQAQWEAWASEHQGEYMTWMDDQETAFMDWVIDQKAAYIDWIQTTESEFTNWVADNEAAFDAWFETIKGKLDGDVAARLTQAVEDLNDRLDNDYYNKTESDEKFERNNQWVDITLYAENWSEDKQYSLEEDYPSDEYDVLDIIPINEYNEEYKAWCRAYCGGYNDVNVIIAKGKVPNIDLHLKMCIRRKEV